MYKCVNVWTVCHRRREGGSPCFNSHALIPMLLSLCFYPYALIPIRCQGEPAEVAEAVFEAALPRNAGDLLPRSQAGIIVAVADRLDSLVRL